MARQLVSGRKYAEARGWDVVAEFVDDGVSATLNRPEDRVGWMTLLASPEWFDAVIIWKVDRLARRVMDFLRADETLQARGAAMVCVEQSLDMTTGEGRAFAQMLAVFGELEASAISARNVAARSFLIQAGRVAGGGLPYGWRSVPNPEGAGLVLAQDPERIEWVRGMAMRALRGDRVTSILRWLDAENAPHPRGFEGVRVHDEWRHGTVDFILRNPILAGMIRFNPSPRPRGRVLDVLRMPDGRPVVRPELAVVTVAERETIISFIDERNRGRTESREARSTYSPMLAQLAFCGGCDRERPMNRGSGAGQLVLRCPRCSNQITVRQLADYLEHRLIAERGPLPMHRIEPAQGEPISQDKLDRIAHALQQAAGALIEDGADAAALTKQIYALKLSRTRQLRAAANSTPERLVQLGLNVGDLWRRCATDDERREVLASQIERLTIYRGRGTRYFNPARVVLEWRPETGLVAPVGIADNEELAYPRNQPDWVSMDAAAKIIGCTREDVRLATNRGEIDQRKVHRVHPSLRRTSVLEYRDSQKT